MAILKPILLVSAFLTAITASPLNGEVKKLQVRDLISNSNLELDAFIEDIVTRRKMKREDVIDGMQVDYVVAEPELRVKRASVGEERHNDAVGQDMLQAANDLCVRQHGADKRALHGFCDGNSPKVACGDPGNGRYSATASSPCPGSASTCKQFRATNYRGESNNFPVCQHKELTDDTTSNNAPGTVYTGFWTCPQAGRVNRYVDIYAQTDTGLHFDWTYTATYGNGDTYIGSQENSATFFAITAPDSGRLTFSHQGNIAAAYIYWSQHTF